MTREAARLGLPCQAPLLVRPRKPCWHLSTPLALRGGGGHADTLVERLRKHPDVAEAEKAGPGFVNLRLAWAALPRAMPTNQAPVEETDEVARARRRAASFLRMVAREQAELPPPALEAPDDAVLHGLIAALLADPVDVPGMVTYLNRAYATRPLLRQPPGEVAAWRWLFRAAGAVLAGKSTPAV